MPRRKRKSNWTAPKASTTSRGYGGRHQAERRLWEPIVAAGHATCCRCGFSILPGQRWHLDHADDGIHYLGVAHARCNLRAAAQKGNALVRERKALEHTPRVGSREW
jgi:hypothetical protein